MNKNTEFVAASNSLHRAWLNDDIDTATYVSAIKTLNLLASINNSES